MSHSFDFMGLSEKLFLLRHLASGTREFCKKNQLIEGPIDYEDDWSMYYLRMRSMVSSKLIELAANIRIVEDTCKHQDTYSDIRDLDALCRDNQPIGVVHQGDFELTLRESCNKIIHATEFDLSIASAKSSTPYFRYSYWDGRCVLKGVHSNKPWNIELNIIEWCGAIDCFMDELSRNIDW
jgi:hypothetical protein